MNCRFCTARLRSGSARHGEERVSRLVNDYERLLPPRARLASDELSIEPAFVLSARISNT